MPQKAKAKSSKYDWSTWKPEPRSKPLGSLVHSLDMPLLSLTLPALPSPFSPAHKSKKSSSTGNRVATQSRKERHRRTRPCTSIGAIESACGRSQEMRSAALLARGTDWICSRADDAEIQPWPWQQRRDRVSPRSPCRSRSHSVPHPNGFKGPRAAGGFERDAPDVLKLQYALNLPKDAMSQACDLFHRYADQPNTGGASLKDRMLTKSGFAKVWFEMTHQEEGTEADIPPQILSGAFRHSTTSQALGLDLAQFATWYSSYYFCENVSLDKDGQHLRGIARKYSMHHSDVETYKQIFDSFDKDRSGTIDSSEFEKLLCKCTKVPTSIGLPPARVKHLWHIADGDGDHEISFEEFIKFYRAYLCTDSTGFEDFYRFGGRRASSA